MPNKKAQSLKTQILVAGGGAAGVPCALAAARAGSKVILCQDRPVLGGNASSEIRMHIVGADFCRGVELKTEARESGIIEELRLDACVQNPQRAATMWDLILYDKCRNEPNITLLLNTTVVGTEMDGDRIRTVRATRESTEEAFEIEASVFIDCTGDGRLGAEAGAEFTMGREDKAAHNETLALDQADSNTLGSSIMYQARKHDRTMPFIAPSWVRDFTEEELRLRLASNTDNPEESMEYGFWWAEWGGHFDTIRENELIRDELMAIVLGIWNYIKNSGKYPHAENWALEWFGWVPGKRESRRFKGLHTLTEQEVLNSQPFDDAIAYGGWPIDLHPPKGVDSPDEPPCSHTHVDYLYDIPLRSCISKNVSNLMFAGRNISATHVAFASTRVMATCATMGQGVGVAANEAVQTGCLPAALTNSPDRVNRIQQTLLRQGAYLIGVDNADAANLAPKANITASSEQAEAPATNVISGQTRALFGEKSLRPERQSPGTHRWMSDPNEGLPARLTLSWPEPVELSQIQLTFDTGSHRLLTQTLSDKWQQNMHWGQPQPETVADYYIECRIDGAWQEVSKVSNNYQRINQQSFENTIRTDSIRITVTRTNGATEARIVEVRAYS